MIDVAVAAETAADLVVAQGDNDICEPTPIPTGVPQATFIEFRTAAKALARPRPNLWLPADNGEASLLFSKPDGPFQIKLMDTSVYGAGAENRRRELARWLFTLDARPEGAMSALLLLHVVVRMAIEHEQVEVWTDDLLDAIGWYWRSREEHQQQRRILFDWMTLFEHIFIIGKRREVYKDRGMAIDLTSRDPLIRITGEQLSGTAGGVMNPPTTICFVAGAWLAKHRHRRHVLTDFGDVRKLSVIPSGRTPGMWAQSIGLALYQKCRERAAWTRSGASRRFIFTRAELLDMFPSGNPVRNLLPKDPKRAESYWEKAVEYLDSYGVVSGYRELDRVDRRHRRWSEHWLQQPLEIIPVEKGLDDLEVIGEVRPSRGRRARKRLRTAEDPLRTAEDPLRTAETTGV